MQQPGKNGHQEHVIPLPIYLGIGAALLVLTVVTILSAQIDLGAFNLPLAMAIATFKGSLVALIFMHLWYDNKFYMMIFLSSLMFLAVFISVTMLDTLRRGDIDAQLSDPIKQQTIIYKTPPPKPAGEAH